MSKKNRHCNKCGKPLHEGDYYGYLPYTCKDCVREYKRIRYRKTRKIKDAIIMDKSTGRIIDKKGCARSIFWSKQMLDDLKRYYPTTTNEEMAGIVGVSKRTMNRKAAELGLKKDPEWIRKVMKQNSMLAVVTMRKEGNGGWFKKGHKFIGNQHRGKESNINE